MAENIEKKNWPSGKDSERTGDDELIPETGQQVNPAEVRKGDEPDTAGQHGDMAVETAKAFPPNHKPLDKDLSKSKNE